MHPILRHLLAAMCLPRQGRSSTSRGNPFRPHSRRRRGGKCPKMFNRLSKSSFVLRKFRERRRSCFYLRAELFTAARGRRRRGRQQRLTRSQLIASESSWRKRRCTSSAARRAPHTPFCVPQIQSDGGS